MSESNSEALRLLRNVRARAAPDSTWVQMSVIEIDALLARADKDNKLQPQGLCETTLTPRFQVPNCTCDTYKDNLGPCLTWWEGGRIGYCVYCDHNLACHVKLSKMLADKDNAAPQVSAQSSELSNASQSGSASAVILEPAVSAPDNAAGQVTWNSSLNSSSMEDRLDLPAPAAPAEAPTPRVDDVYQEAQGFQRSLFVVPLDFARHLERQRDEFKEELDAAIKALGAAVERERLANMRADMEASAVDELRRELAAAQSASGALRWVPCEPTRAMERAGMLRAEQSDVFGGVRALTYADCAKIYRAMLEAAPFQQPSVPVASTSERKGK